MQGSYPEALGRSSLALASCATASIAANSGGTGTDGPPSKSREPEPAPTLLGALTSVCGHRILEECQR